MEWESHLPPLQAMDAKGDGETPMAMLKGDAQALQSELAALTKMQAEMDKIRSDTRADYLQAKTNLGTWTFMETIYILVTMFTSEPQNT